MSAKDDDTDGPPPDAPGEGASRLRRQVPGRMGLGTDQPAYIPPKGWKPPKKPDLMTANVKPRGGRRK